MGTGMGMRMWMGMQQTMQMKCEMMCRNANGTKPSYICSGIERNEDEICINTGALRTMSPDARVR